MQLVIICFYKDRSQVSNVFPKKNTFQVLRTSTLNKIKTSLIRLIFFNQAIKFKLTTHLVMLVLSKETL